MNNSSRPTESSKDDDQLNRANNEEILKSLRQLNSCITLKSVNNSNSDKSEGPASLQKKSPEESSQSKDWLKSWSQRCLSVSFKRNESDSGEKPLENGPSGSESGPSSRENSRDSFHGDRSDSSEESQQPNFKCSKCQAPFNSQPEFLRHFIGCNKVATSPNSAPTKPSQPPASKVNLPSGLSVKTSSQPNLPPGISVSSCKTNLPPGVSVTSKPIESVNPESNKPKLPPGISVKTVFNTNKSNSQSEINTEVKNTKSLPPSTSTKPIFPPGISIKSSSALPKQEHSFNSEIREHSPVQSPDRRSPPLYKLTPPQEKPQQSFESFSNSSSQNFSPSKNRVSKKSTSSSALVLQAIKRSAVSRKSTAKRSIVNIPCWVCKIQCFPSYSHFEQHHKKHITQSVTVALEKISETVLREAVGHKEILEESDESDSNHSNSSSRSGKSESLKVTFKISHGDEGKKTTVQIVNNNIGMNEEATYSKECSASENDNYSSTVEVINDSMGPINHPEMITGDPLPVDNGSQENIAPYNSELSEVSPRSDRSNSTDHGFEGFGPATPSEAPSSTYQPQFESFTEDWFNEFESGPRIAAALAGSLESNSSASSGYNSSEDPLHRKDAESNLAEQDESGLFSQEVLGDQSSVTDQQQGSFEQLCLNDSYNQEQVDNQIDPLADPQVPYQDGQSTGDPLSQLDYLNNSQQYDETNSSQHMNEIPHMNSHGATSNTSPSIGHPTTPPTDTSFRALATSPLTDPTSPLQTNQASPLQPGMITPINNTSLTPPLSSSNSNEETITTPRLTIANNLMPTTTSSSLTPPLMSGFGQQQWPRGNPPQNFNAGYISGPTLPTPMRPHTRLPPSYRPSPPPRIRGRPPLMTPPTRPLIRGPGRPPGANLPPMMPGGRGMMPGMRQQMYNRGQAQKRTAPTNNQSPNKSLRRDDINIPSRQKDNDCQIIAVNNRPDGLPVIANVQGGSKNDRSSTRTSSPATTSESTIHLSDSITLSVRQNNTRESGRSEKSGEAGVVANLLASRGITVTPAAGEKEGNSGSSNGEKRLPSASDLNLSSAISVHPPTSRDRDGFAVPHPPSSRVTVNNNVDRPPRAPTIDLTQESTSGSLPNKYNCDKCDKSFPTQAFLADHSKMHQQHQQTRMPYKCHLCTAGFSNQKGQQQHYQQFHMMHLSAADVAIPVFDYKNPANVQKLSRLGVTSFLPLNNLQNRGGGGVVGIPILTLENIRNGQMNLQQWGITDVLTLGPPKAISGPPR